MTGPRLESLSFSVDGMDCASCVGPLESALSALPGVESVSANLAIERVEVVIDPERVSARDIVSSLERAGHPVRPDLAKFRIAIFPLKFIS